MRRKHSVPKSLPRVLHPRVRVYCKSCKHVARRYFDKVKDPCVECGSSDTTRRKPGSHIAA